MVCSGTRVYVRPDPRLPAKPGEYRFPLREKELLYALSVREPKLLLNENSDRIGLSVEVQIGILGGKKIAGSLTADASLRYDAAQTAFFLDNPRVTDVRIPGLPKTIADKVPGVATIALQGVLKEKPVYRLTDEDAGLFVLRRTLKAVKIRSGQVEATLGVR